MKKIFINTFHGKYSLAAFGSETQEILAGQPIIGTFFKYTKGLEFSLRFPKETKCTNWSSLTILFVLGKKYNLVINGPKAH